MKTVVTYGGKAFIHPDQCHDKCVVLGPAVVDVLDEYIAYSLPNWCSIVLIMA